jgi:hypothetical protein
VQVLGLTHYAYGLKELTKKKKPKNQKKKKKKKKKTNERKKKRHSSFVSLRGIFEHQGFRHTSKGFKPHF